VIQEDRAAVARLLDEHNTLTLATGADGAVWAATVFYARDRDLNLYFVSDPRTRHARDLTEQARAVAAINADCARWSDVRGLQIEGTVDVLEGASRVRGIGIYLARFADVKALFDMPRSKDEETIAARLRAANLYCLRPRWIRLIDNSRWFGFRQEFEV